MSVVTFDGQPFEINLPANALNAEDFVGQENLFVEQTLEPAIIADMRVVLSGKVIIANPDKRSF
jgi:hypothetical protein